MLYINFLLDLIWQEDGQVPYFPISSFYHLLNQNFSLFIFFTSAGVPVSNYNELHSIRRYMYKQIIFA
jgi:hypothetical protein